MVALTPRTCVELGIELSEEDKKRTYVEVSGRKGLGVKADDLIDKLIEKALEEVNSRHPEAPEEARSEAATQIAIGALRYFMLKFTRNSVIAFDLQRGAELRRRDRTLCAIRRGARAATSCASSKSAAKACRISRATLTREAHGAAACNRKTSGSCC